MLEGLINSNIYSGIITPNSEKFIKSLNSNFNSEEYEFNAQNNHYLNFVDKDIDDYGTLIETPIYFLNDDDITDITTRLDKLDVERKTNLALITEVAKQFTEIIEGNLKPEDAANKIISDIEIYLSE